MHSPVNDAVDSLALINFIKGPIAKDTLRTSIVLVIRLVLQAGTLLMVARLLGPKDFGAYAGVAALAVMLGTLSTFGTHLVLLAEASRSFQRRLQVLNYCITTTLISGTVLLGLYMLISLTLLANAKISPHLLGAIGLTELLVQPLVGLPAVQHQAKQRIARSQLLITLPLALRLLLIVAISVLQPLNVLATYVYGCLVASIIGLSVATVSLKGAWPRVRRWRLASIAELRHSAGFAVLNITTAAPSEIDKALATRLLPLSAAGLYAAASRVIWALTLPVFAMLLSALPRLFRTANEQLGIKQKLLAVLYGSAFGYGSALVILVWIAAPYIAWFFGGQYKGIEEVIRWLSVAIPGITLRLTSGAVLMTIGKTWARVIFEIAGLVALVTIAIILAPGIGMKGMAIAVICAEWTMAVVGCGLVITGIRRRKISRTGSMREQSLW